MNNINFSESDILKVIRNLDPNKAHGHDEISIRMLQICDKTICKPLYLIFSSCMESDIFPSQWKMANVVPAYKRDDKQNVKNYRPVSLLPIFGKVFERLIYNEMYSFFIENDLISANQSGFKQGDSCINQLLSITHEIYQSLDQGYEVRGVFLDISKAFDKVWHKGLLFKLKQNGINGHLLRILENFLNERKQRVVLNGQTSSWSDVLAGVPQGSILGPLLFLIYINDLSDGLQCNPKLFADDTSLFSTVYNITEATNNLNNDLAIITKWAHQWKMSFNPDISKQAHEVIFSRKNLLTFHPPLTFNSIPVAQTNCQKHLGMQLDKKLNFDEHLSKVESKVNKTIGIIRKLQNVLPRPALLTIFRSFIRPHLDYGDIIYDKAYNESFHAKLESLQYNASLAITGAIKGSSTEKIYEELGLETLKSRRWYRKMSFLYKVLKNESPSYLFQNIPNAQRQSHRQTRNSGKIPSIVVKHDYFKNSFFPSAITEWNKLDCYIKNSDSFAIFKKRILEFIRPKPNSIFNIHNPLGIKYLTRLRVGFSHLKEHKFRHNFQDSIDPMCNCGSGIETTIHFFLHCANFNTQRQTLFDKIATIDTNILTENDDSIVSVLLFGKQNCEKSCNKSIINATIEFILSTERFSNSLF